MLQNISSKGWQVIRLPVSQSRSGSHAFVEGFQEVPFKIEHMSYIYDAPVGSQQAGYAQRITWQLIAAISGSCKVSFDNGESEETVCLSRPDVAVLVGPIVWRAIKDFSTGAGCLILSSMPYNDADRIQDYEDFRRFAASAIDQQSEIPQWLRTL